MLRHKEGTGTVARMRRIEILIGVAVVLLSMSGLRAQTQGQGAGTPPPAGRQGGGRSNAPAPDPTKPARLEMTEGTTARYKVREQLAGVSFPSDAVGTTSAVSGVICIRPRAPADEV